MEIIICHDIIGAHYNNMIMQDGCNKVEFWHTETKFLTSFYKKQYVIHTKLIPTCKLVGNSSVNYTNQYVQLDKPNNKLFNENLYILVELMGEVMGISKDNIPYRIEKYKARAKFVSDIGANFPIGALFYSRKGPLGNWYDVWIMERIQNDNNSDFISMCVNETKSVPEYLSHRQSNYDIDIIDCESDISKRLCKAIIRTVIPYGCVPQFTKPAKETHFLEDATNFILSLDNDDKKKLITNMREFNCHGNTDHSKYDLFLGVFYLCNVLRKWIRCSPPLQICSRY